MPKTMPKGERITMTETEFNLVHTGILDGVRSAIKAMGKNRDPSRKDQSTLQERQHLEVIITEGLRDVTSVGGTITVAMRSIREKTKKAMGDAFDDGSFNEAFGYLRKRFRE